MIQETEFIVQEGIKHEVLNGARMNLNLTIDDLAKKSKIPEGTVKNIVLGKTRNPQVCNLLPICKVLNVPIESIFEDDEEEKKAIETKAIKEENVSVIALKEIYEQQMKETKEINEAHISNIRSHYEQHHEDLKENYEKRLSDKREIIDDTKSRCKHLERENLIYKIIFIVLVLIVCILEFTHPESGWIRF